MEVPDANLLFYAIDERAPDHGQASSWLADSLSGPEPMGLAWSVLLAFNRIPTRPRIFEHPLTPAEAFGIVEDWLARPNVIVIHPTERHFGIVRELLEPLGTAGNLTSDADLAALAIEHGAELCSADSDFGRFQGLRWTNPLKR